MANNKFYGYSPKNDKPTKKQGQAYSGLEKSSRAGQMTKDGTYANLGNRLDRVNPYEFRKGMDYELTQLGISRLAESTPDEREKATESVLKNLEEKHPAYYSALLQFETGMNQGSNIKEKTFNQFLKTYSLGHGDGMMSVEKEFKDDKMIELKEAIRTQIKEVLLEGKKDKEKDDDDLDKEAGKGAKKGSKKLSKFDKEREAIEKHLEDLKEKKDKELERYKKSKKDKKAVDAYKKSIDLSDGDKKKLEKTAEKFDVPSKEYVAKDIPGTIKDLEKRLKAIDKDEEKAVAKLREEKNDIALTDMTREEQIRLLNIIKERGISLREGKDSIKIYYEIAKLSFLEGLAKGLKL
jgi:hypothetical protein|tara:strand:+ start:658 stop:1710 length:1053 start_codon:yes stop_codon:yes gene_type:complete